MSTHTSPLRRANALRTTSYLTLLLLLLAGLCTGHAIRTKTRNYPRFPASDVASISSLSDPAPYISLTDPKSFLSRILIPRPPDTPNSLSVRNSILSIFQSLTPSFPNTNPTKTGKLGWHTLQHSFIASTPEGDKNMTNLIFTKNPSAPRKLIIAAHYDSKFFPRGSGMEGFVGATDSAAPCAFMVDLAVALDDALDRRERGGAGKGRDTTLQLAFFDGEEAYRQWTSTDSIYGSSELAKHWGETYWNPSPSTSSSKSSRNLEARRFKNSYGPVQHIQTIEHMVLLDLLGAPNPTIPSYYDSTKWLHTAFTDAEKRLDKAGVLWPKASKGGKSFFSNKKTWGGIEDDHLPFLRNGVPILHVIPSPFPNVWHKLSDDREALDYGTMYAWCMILRLVVAEYLELDVGGGMRKGLRGDEVGAEGFDSIGKFKSKWFKWGRVELVSLTPLPTPLNFMQIKC
ncbi:related to Glutaminyl-peptide cyclotransferase precursor [Ustilago bromivora]|uniref:Peptide hydrolase n=1 Tax=Ustilago bromivora TaxID=307758 RepID=A0A8H8QPA7_9BASI|nr:related to Glutaminyl-peptide cyclotransferase precursor [Ustilago bromivora]